MIDYNKTKTKRGQMPSKYASRCKACDSPLDSFHYSKLLPDGSVDDLCYYCKEAIFTSQAVRYRDYILEHIEDDSCNVDELD